MELARARRTTKGGMDGWKRVISLLGGHEQNGKFKLFQLLGVWRPEQGDWYFDQRLERLLKEKRKSNALRYMEILLNQPKKFIVPKPVSGFSCYERHNGRSRIGEHWGDHYWASQLLYTKTDLLGIAVDIKEGKGVVVSNGSFKDQNGTAAVVIEGTKAGRRVTSSVIVSGGSSKQCAYRSEVARILAALQMVNTVAQFYGIEEGKCIMGCDGQSALYQFFQKRQNSEDIPHFDVIAAAKAEVPQLPIRKNNIFQDTSPYIRLIGKQCWMRRWMDSANGFGRKQNTKVRWILQKTGVYG
jgi:hypothetical protein